MKPDKPGFWWCREWPENAEVIVEIAEVIVEIGVPSSSRLESKLIVRVIGHSAEYDLDLFSKSVEWISQAHPPKRVDRYGISVGISPGDLRAEPHERGLLVFYDDVKEFLLKDDDND
jgi:hypothetical protein